MVLAFLTNTRFEILVLAFQRRLMNTEFEILALAEAHKHSVSNQGPWMRVMNIQFEILALAFQRTLMNTRFEITALAEACLLYTSPSPRDQLSSRMPSSA